VRNFVQKRVRGAGSDQTVKINPKLDFEGRLPSMGTIEVWLNP